MLSNGADAHVLDKEIKLLSALSGGSYENPTGETFADKNEENRNASYREGDVAEDPEKRRRNLCLTQQGGGVQKKRAHKIRFLSSLCNP